MKPEAIGPTSEEVMRGESKVGNGDEKLHGVPLHILPMDMIMPQHVEVLIREDGKNIWVNVDGMCVFRAAQIKRLKVNDQRKSKSKGKKI